MQIGKMDFLINAKSRNQLVIVYLSQGMPYISQLLVLYNHIGTLKMFQDLNISLLIVIDFKENNVIRT